MSKYSHKIILVILLLFAYITRLWNVSTPPEYYFDEVYHAFTANYYAQNDPKGYEWWHSAPEGVAFEWLHPPLAKLFQGFSIYVLGDNSFAWRLPSVVFGTLVIWAVYYLTYQLTQRRSLALVAAAVASLDGLLLALSRITMNDIFVTFFIILAFAFHWKYVSQHKRKSAKYYMLLAGLAAGLAMASKWSGVFVLGLFWLTELILLATNKSVSKVKRLIGVLVVFELVPMIILWIILSEWVEMTKGNLPEFSALVLSLVFLNVIIGGWVLGFKKLTLLLTSFVILPLSVYVLSYGQFWLHERPNNLKTFRDLHHQIWWYQTNLEATHPWQSRPDQWFLNTKPVWFYVDYQADKVGNIFALANPVIAWGGIISLFIVGVIGVIRKKWAYIYLIGAYFVVWLPWVVSPRIMFYYHYTPAMALLCIIVALTLWHVYQIKYLRWISIIFGLAIVVSFVYFYPHWTGMLVSKTWSDHYYWLPSWKP